MADLIYVAILIAFFAVSALFVEACDRIIGSDDEALADSMPALQESEQTKVAA